MSHSLSSQAEFFQKLGDGSNKLVIFYHQTRAPGATSLPPKRTQTLAEVADFINSGEAANLKNLNLSIRPDDTLPICLADTIKAPGRHSASPVGITLEEYASAMAQPLPLGDLDAPDIALRRGQAQWVATFEADLTRLSRDVYARSRQDQRRLIWLAGGTALITAAPVFATAVIGTGWATTIGVAAAIAAIATMQAVTTLNAYARREALKDFRNRIEIASTEIEALTRHRQDNLVALIDALFAAAGHLHEDAPGDVLSARMDGHIGMIFALRGLLSSNRKCTRLHVRRMEIVRETLSIQLRDEALIKRRRINGRTNRSYPRIDGRIRWLTACLLTALVPAAITAGRLFAPLLPALPLTAVVTATVCAVAGVAFALVRVLGLHRSTDILISAKTLAELCDEDAFDKIQGPADVPLEQGFLKMIDRWLTRLIREEDKQH